MGPVYRRPVSLRTSWLNKKLEPLLQLGQSNIAHRPSRDNYFEPLIKIETEQLTTWLRKEDHWLDITTILPAAGLNPRPESARRVNEHKPHNGGHEQQQGTYRSPSFVLKFCEVYKLFDFQRILLEELKKLGYKHQDED
jgi:hypothetical protein